MDIEMDEIHDIFTAEAPRTQRVLSFARSGDTDRAKRAPPFGHYSFRCFIENIKKSVTFKS
jgi:hypothetical protein